MLKVSQVARFIGRQVFSNNPAFLLGTPPSGASLWSALKRPNENDSDADLLSFGLKAVNSALDVDFSKTTMGRPESSELGLFDVWPGEHYKLLSGIASQPNIKRVVEIGTYRGAGSLALLNSDIESLISYDIITWNEIEQTLLRESDFNERFEQRLGDLTDPTYLSSQVEELQRADLIFVDAPKDGVFEYKFRDMVMPLLRSGTYVIFDDIRFLNMLELWNSLSGPKLDLTSFGHYTGTGLVRIN